MSEIKELYDKLHKRYGKPSGQWKLWCKRPKTTKEREEVIIGAILTQRTNWRNVELSIRNLKKAKSGSLKSIYQMRTERFAPLVKSSGFYFTKAKYLHNLAKFIIEKYGNVNKMKRISLIELRKELLNLKGIGPETADSILLYALDKAIFVIDEYTKRLVEREKISKDLSYHFLQKLFQDNLKKDFRLYQDFHALIVIDGKG